jgi:transcriptional regulator with XRE-family HTH domain
MGTKLIGNEWLQQRMQHIGYTSYQDVATRMGIHKGNLWRYFDGQNVPNMGLMPIMCKILYCTPDELLRALRLLGPRQTL